MLSQLLNKDNVVIQPTEPVPEAPKPETPGYGAPAVSGSGDGVGAPVSAPQSLIEKAKAAAEAQGIDFAYSNEDELINALISKERHNQYLENERTRLLGSSRQPEATPEEPTSQKPQEQTVSEDDILAGVGESRQAEINSLKTRLATLNPVDNQEEYLEIRGKLDDLQLYEINRSAEIASRAVQATQKVRQHFTEREQVMMQAVNNLKQEGQTKQELEDDRRLATRFQKEHPEFATETPIDKLDAQYLRWAKDLHTLRYKETTTDPMKLKRVVDDWLDGDIDLKQLANRNGVVEPKGMDKYVEICNLLGIRATLNAMPNAREHSLEDAWIYKLQTEGRLSEAMKVQRDLGAQAGQEAVRQRDTNFAKVLDANETQGQDPNEGMTDQKAWQIINSIPALEARLDPAKREIRNRAAAFLGLQNI